MAETGCGDPPADLKSPTTAATPTNQIIDDVKSHSEESRPDLVLKVAKLESQIEDVTSTLKDEQENRRLIQHELEASRTLCEHLGGTLKGQRGLSTVRRGWPHPTQDEGIQTEAGMGTSLTEESTIRNEAVNQTGNEIPSGLKQHDHTKQYLAASHLLEEYTANQKALEYQVKRLRHECASKDDEMATVRLKYSHFIKRNAQLEKDIESLRSDLSKRDLTLERQERLLEERNVKLREKTDAVKKLNAQKDSLAKKYSQAKTKAAKLKEVVVFFNETVSEFRKEREKLLNSALATRGTTTALKGRSTGTPREVGKQEGHRHRRHTGNVIGPQIIYSSSGSPVGIHRSNHEASPRGWYRGESPEIETDKGTTDLRRHGPVFTTDEPSLRFQATTRSPSHNSHAGVNRRGHVRSKSEQLVLRTLHHQRGGEEQGNLRNEENDAGFGEQFIWSRLSSDDSSQSESSLSGSEIVKVDGQMEDSDSEISQFAAQTDPRTSSNDGYCGGRHRLPSSSEVVLRGTSSSRGSEAAAETTEITASAAAEHDCAEGLILVKHDMENYALKATDRSWNFIYIVHKGRRLWFYENRDFLSLELTLDGMDPIDLTGAIICPLRDYIKRRYVLCVQLTNGARYLFQAQDESEMLYWVCRLSTGTGDAQQGRGHLFAQRRAPLRGSPSKTARLKNFIRGGLSAVWK